MHRRRGGVVVVGCASVNANKAGTVEEVQIFQVAVALAQTHDGLEVAANRIGSHRGRKCINDAQPRLRCVARQFRACLLNRLAYADGTRGISTGAAMGLATVSISAAVSPKLLLN